MKIYNFSNQDIRKYTDKFSVFKVFDIAFSFDEYDDTIIVANYIETLENLFFFPDYFNVIIPPSDPVFASALVVAVKERWGYYPTLGRPDEVIGIVPFLISLAGAKARMRKP